CPTVLLRCPATTLLSPLSLHDALPIWRYFCAAMASSCGLSALSIAGHRAPSATARRPPLRHTARPRGPPREEALARHVLGQSARSEEHTSELQSRVDLVCRLLLEKKKK